MTPGHTTGVQVILATTITAEVVATVDVTTTIVVADGAMTGQRDYDRGDRDFGMWWLWSG